MLGAGLGADGAGDRAASAERVQSRLARWTAMPCLMASSACGLCAWTPEAR